MYVPARIPCASWMCCVWLLVMGHCSGRCLRWCVAVLLVWFVDWAKPVSFELGCGHGQLCLHGASAMALAGCCKHGRAQIAVMAHCWHLGARCTFQPLLSIYKKQRTVSVLGHCAIVHEGSHAPVLVEGLAVGGDGDHGVLGVGVTWGDVGTWVLLVAHAGMWWAVVRFCGGISSLTECRITHAVCVSLLVSTAAV
jgi:hypothetical protein